MKSAYKQSGIKPEQLEEHEFPFLFERAWNFFSELNSSRSSNGFGLNSISYTEIHAWNQLTNSEITEKEVEILRLLDYEYLTIHQKKDK